MWDMWVCPLLQWTIGDERSISFPSKVAGGWRSPSVFEEDELIQVRPGDSRAHL